MVIPAPQQEPIAPSVVAAEDEDFDPHGVAVAIMGPIEGDEEAVGEAVLVYRMRPPLPEEVERAAPHVAGSPFSEPGAAGGIRPGVREWVVLVSNHVLPQVHILVTTTVYCRKAPDGFPNQPPLAFDSIRVNRSIHWINNLQTLVDSCMIPATPLWQVQVLINPGLVAYHARARFYPPVYDGSQCLSDPVRFVNFDRQTDATDGDIIVCYNAVANLVHKLNQSTTVPAS
ncbi:unnamed protein product [Allacma fusca]|uniref:Uncharacterized protein n=1 Tax=Allacma fusca TaxID=39272 RepID=A0A8J2LH55_9HEXA|nr:unnamed protein product [Allacma fusca]